MELVPNIGTRFMWNLFLKVCGLNNVSCKEGILHGLQSGGF